MIHHVSVGSNDLRRAKAFYLPLLALIGFRVIKETDKAAHFDASEIVFSIETPVDGSLATSGNGVHIAFQAPDRETVRRFHAAALAAGGTDEGWPAIRENYNAHYYAAFVRDPDGNKIEAVTFTARDSYGLQAATSRSSVSLGTVAKRGTNWQAHFPLRRVRFRLSRLAFAGTFLLYSLTILSHHAEQPRIASY